MPGFGTMSPNANGAAGLALLKQIQAMQGGGGAPPVAPGGMPDAAGNWPQAPAPAVPGAAGPNFMQNGLIGRMMSGNPGGLIGAILNRQTAPVNPGVPPVAGNPAYPPGPMAQGPMAGGPAPGGGFPFPGIGMLSGLLNR